MTVAEGVRLKAGVADALKLQWGRNLTVAEGAQILIVLSSEPGTSMGPQLDSCGRVGELVGFQAHPENFNGAAT